MSWMEGLCHFFQLGTFIRVRAEELWTASRLGTTLAAGGGKEGIIFSTLGNPGLEKD